MSFHASHSNRCLGEITLHEEDTQVVEHAVRIFFSQATRVPVPRTIPSASPFCTVNRMLKTREYHHHTCSLLTGLFELLKLEASFSNYTKRLSRVEFYHLIA